MVKFIILITAHTVGDFDEDESTSDSPQVMELWLILQILCAILLVFSLVCCCFMCSGETRNHSNQKNRPRDIINVSAIIYGTITPLIMKHFCSKTCK